MQHFTSNDKLSTLIHSNHYLLPVINRFGIRLGFKDQTVSELCVEKGVNINFFLTIANTYTDKDYFPEAKLLAFSPKLLIDYLRKTHQYYFDYLFPEVERRLDIVIQSHKDISDDLNLIKTFYTKYKEELSKHIEEEEDTVFPYILSITDCFEKNKPVPEAFKAYSMQSFEQEHTNVDQKIYDLKNIVIKYLEPNYNDNDCNAFLFSIFQFEQDLLDHARIEDKILLTIVLDIEKKLNNA